MFFHGHCPEEILHLPQPSSNELIVTVLFKGFWWRYLDWQPSYYLGRVLPEIAASLGFSWAVNIFIKSIIFSKKFDMRILASWGVAKGGALLGACEDSPSANSVRDHLEMVLVSPGLHPILWAPVPTLPRVLVPGSRQGHSFRGLYFLYFFVGVSCGLATLDSPPAILIKSNKSPFAALILRIATLPLILH